MTDGRRPLTRLVVWGVLLAATATGVKAEDRPLAMPTVTVAVSTSMPIEHVRGLAQSLAKTGGRLVVRGAPMTESTQAYFGLPAERQEAVRTSIRAGLAHVARLGVNGMGVAIDPAFFKRHDIEAVPVVVVETLSRQTCDVCKTSKRFDETTATPNGRVYRVRGDVTLAHALRTLVAETTGADRSAIQTLLDRLEGTTP